VLLRVSSACAFGSNRQGMTARLGCGARSTLQVRRCAFRPRRQPELKHASLQRAWNMDRVSDSPYPEVRLAVIVDQYLSHNSLRVDQDEFGSFCRHLKNKQMRLPRKNDLKKKQQAILKFPQQSFTDVH
jgi:hypothetical protein